MVLSLDELDEVVGGQNTMSFTTPLGGVSSNQTDYGLCHGSAQRYCDTRPSNRTSVLGIDTGVNPAKSAECMKSTLPGMCGTPKK